MNNEIQKPLPYSDFNGLSDDLKRYTLLAHAEKLNLNIAGKIRTKPECATFISDFIRIAYEKRSTHKRYGAKAIFEELRYEHHRRDGGHEFAIDNNHTADAARLAESMIVGLGGFFEKRTRRAA